MERERALFIVRQENLSFLTDEYKRVYFGDEFCERLLPGPQSMKSVIKQVCDRGCAFTAVTPYVTEQGLAKVRSLCEILPDGTEIVFNDWGVLRMLRRDFPHLRPVLGRLLTKIKRGPRLSRFMDTLPPDAITHFRKTNLDVPVYRHFLAENGIYRAELDNPVQGLDFEGLPPKLGISLYIPFVYVTTTRFCLVANCDQPDKKGFIGVFPCNQECRRYTFYLDNAAMGMMLIRRGNTVFYKNTSIPAEYAEAPVDRLVISPEIPH